MENSQNFHAETGETFTTKHSRSFSSSLNEEKKSFPQKVLSLKCVEKLICPPFGNFLVSLVWFNEILKRKVENAFAMR